MIASHQEAVKRITNRIAQGEYVPLSDYLPWLAAFTPRERIEFCLNLANAFLMVGDEAQAAGLLERVWWLSGQNPELLDTYVHFKLKSGDLTAIRAAYKHQGMVAARSGKTAEALAWFNHWQLVYPKLLGQDRYEYDYEILAAIDDLAAPHRFQTEALTPAPGERIRLAYLMFGVCHANSVIVRIAHLFARHHDPARFELAYFVPDSASAVLASPQGQANLEGIAALGWPVTVAPDDADEGQSLRRLAEQIHAFQPHLLILDCGLADLRHHYIRALRPAARTLGFVSGPPAQFIAPDLDSAIAWTWHPLMDTPVPCRHVTLEMTLPDIAGLRLRTRASLGIPDGVPLLATAGRPQKLSDPAFWSQVASALDAHPDVWFLAIGMAEEEAERWLSGLPDPMRRRMRFLPWMADYLEVLGNADLVLDTYPSGGGVVLLDAMALGIPVLAFANDYLNPFDQVIWSPAQEFMPECELVVPRGDEAAYHAVLGRLIGDPEYRRELGEACRRHVMAYFGQPARMVAACEHIYAEHVGARPEADTAPAVAALRSNLVYWQQIQADGYFEQHPCYRGLRDFDRDEQIVQLYTPLRPGMKVVEIGCGYGRDVARFAPLVGHVWGIDVSATILDKARRYTAERGITNFTPVLAARWKDDIPDGIDLVWSIVVFQHLTRDLVRDYLGGLAAKLAPGGMFLCQFAEPALGEVDARLEKYEPSVKWTRGQITALVAELGMELFTLDDFQVSGNDVWHWAWFGRGDAWPVGHADLSAEAAWAGGVGERTVEGRIPARLPNPSSDDGGPHLTSFVLRATGATGYEAQLTYQRGVGLQGSATIHYALKDSLLALLSLNDPKKGFFLEVTPGGIVDCWSYGHDFEREWAAIRAQAAQPSIAFTILDSVLGGGAIMLFRYADWLLRLGYRVAVYSNDKCPERLTLEVPFHTLPDEQERYAAIAEDVIIVYSALELPHVLKAQPKGKAILHLCQGLEQQHYSKLRGMRAFQDYFHLLHSLPVGRITVSFHLHQHFLKSHGQISFQVTNGIDLNLFSARHGHRPNSAELLFLFVGNPRQELKNIDTCLAALHDLAERHPDWCITLAIVMGDTCAEPLSLVTDTPFRVEMHYGLNAAQMRALYQRADVLLAVSVYEGFGLPSIEAMACGVPVLQSDSRGLDGYLRDGVDCLLVPAEHAARQAEGLERILTEPGLYERLVAGGLETAARFSLHGQFDAFVREFQTLLGRDFEADRLATIRAGLDVPVAPTPHPNPPPQAGEGAPGGTPHDSLPPAFETMPPAKPASAEPRLDSAAPRFSILVPTYNHAHYLPAALDSLIAQTYADWEAVVVNDGSSDATPQVLADYAAREPRIRVFDQANGGTAVALNTALEQARGEWVCWLSSDDLFQPDKLANHVEAIRQAPDYDCFFSNFYLLHDPEGRLTASGIDVESTIPPLGEQVIRLFRYNYFNGITIAVRRAVFAAVGPFRAEYRHGQDFDMWLRIAARYRWMYIDHPTCVTRQHEGQGTRRAVMTGIYDSTLACLDYLNQHPFADLFPGVDLDDPDQATAALRLSLEVLLDPNGYVNLGGLVVSLAERVVEWLVAHPVAEFRQALRQLVEAERFAGIDFPRELMEIWQRFATTDGPVPYHCRAPLAPLTERVRALALAGETERAAELAAYLAVVRTHQWGGA